MAEYMATTAGGPPKGWMSRLFRGLIAKDQEGPAHSFPQARPGKSSSASATRGIGPQLIENDRYSFVLMRDAAESVSEADTRAAWSALDRLMAVIPTGTVPVVLADGRVAPTEIAGYYLDRHAVTNREFERFVNSGGYDTLEIWPQEVWPSLMKFTDRTHLPGPREWENGRFPSGKGDHPVVGICWFEAAAYAAWVGKRLPTAAEWQKAAGWPEHFSGGSCSRYPWGDIFDPTRANISQGEGGCTEPVDARPKGATPNGIYQLCGNVWEWLMDRLDAIPCDSDETFQPARPMRRLAGGAFDTYFPAEATTQFITGQPELDRRDNIGFRCALPMTRLRNRS